jgi:hypothetical protein
LAENYEIEAQTFDTVFRNGRLVKVAVLSVRVKPAEVVVPLEIDFANYDPATIDDLASELAARVNVVHHL